MTRGLAAIGLDLPVATHAARYAMINIAATFASARLLRAVVGHRSEAMHARYQATQGAEVIELGRQVSGRLIADAKPPRV